jgi:hypothetical protein
MIVHGAKLEEAKEKQHNALCLKVKEELNLFFIENFIVSASFHSFYTRKTKDNLM